MSKPRLIHIYSSSPDDTSDAYITFEADPVNRLPDALVEHLPPAVRSNVKDNIVVQAFFVPLSYAVDCWPWLRPPYAIEPQDGLDLTEFLMTNAAAPQLRVSDSSIAAKAATSWAKFKAWFGFGGGGAK